MIRKIALLTHCYDNAGASGNYLVDHIARVWRDRGIEVETVAGIDRPVDADLLLMHVDLTRVPAEYIGYGSRYPRVINGAVADISKRRISRNLVAVADDYQGAVLVKTDLNAAAGPELNLLKHRNRLRYQATRVLRRVAPWYIGARFPGGAYRVYQSKKDVPWPVWWNPLLVVEKFTPEVSGEGYWLRQWVFAGEAELSIRMLSRTPIVKADHIIKRVDGGEVPREVREMRAMLNVDYGKFDYVVVDQGAIVLDVNKTPTVGVHFSIEKNLDVINAFADSLSGAGS